jgi:cell division protein FtsZ
MVKLPPYSDDPLINSRLPHQLKNGRGQFLGFRNVKDLQKQKQQSSSTNAAATTSDTALQSSIGAGALMPDGGLSPCVIRVLGVGGGGCNAVRRKKHE